MNLVIAFLAYVPLTPWWFIRRRQQERNYWVRHVRQYYSIVE
jgi:hypothetical protein